MAKKKVAKKKIKRKLVSAVNLIADTPEPEVVPESEPEAEPAPPLAIAEEATMKVIDQGRITYYTESDYRKKFG